MARIEFLYLSRHEVEELLPDVSLAMEIVEQGLVAHGCGNVVLPPKAHIHLDDRYNGHFNVLPGYASHIDRAGVKVMGDYVDNWKHSLPSEVALLALYEPRTGVPLYLLDATATTWLRTGAVTGIGIDHLARKDAAILAHLGARGTAFSNIAAIAAPFPQGSAHCECPQRNPRGACPQGRRRAFAAGLPRRQRPRSGRWRRHRGRGHAPGTARGPRARCRVEAWIAPGHLRLGHGRRPRKRHGLRQARGRRLGAVHEGRHLTIP